jgi:hypothetical protein
MNLCMKIIILLVSLVGLLTSCRKDVPKDIEKYGVDIKWHQEGATPSYRWIEVNSSYGKCPLSFGGIEDPELEFDDYNSDGQTDIIFGSKTTKQIVSIDPKTKKWIVLRDDMAGATYKK